MDKKLNNLLGIEEYSFEKLNKSAKPTKRTDVAKDILAESINEKPAKKDIIISGKYNNLISLDDFGTKDLPKNVQKHSKRTETGKDIINEKKVKIDDDDDVKVKVKCKEGKNKKCKPNEDKYDGLTAKQKKLPDAFKDNIIKKMRK